MSLSGYTIGVTEDGFVALNLPPDELTPTGATILLSSAQAKALSRLLTEAAKLIESDKGGH